MLKVSEQPISPRSRHLNNSYDGIFWSASLDMCSLPPPPASLIVPLHMAIWQFFPSPNCGTVTTNNSVHVRCMYRGRREFQLLSGSPSSSLSRRLFIHPSRPADRSVRRKWSATAAACSIYLFCSSIHASFHPTLSLLSLLSLGAVVRPPCMHGCPFLMRLFVFARGEIENLFFGGPEPCHCQRRQISKIGGPPQVMFRKSA